MHPFLRRIGVCIRPFEARALSSIVFGVVLGRGAYSFHNFGSMRGGAPPSLVDSRTGRLARACSSISKPVVAPDMKIPPLGATPAHLPCLLLMRGLFFLSNFRRMPIGCSSAPRMGPVIDLVELALMLVIDSGELKSMSLGLRHQRHLCPQRR